MNPSPGQFLGVVVAGMGESVDPAVVQRALRRPGGSDFPTLARAGICYIELQEAEEEGGTVKPEKLLLYTERGLDNEWGKGVRQCNNDACYDRDGLRTRGVGLERCVCRTAWYCDVACQRANRRFHASLCRELCPSQRPPPKATVTEAWGAASSAVTSALADLKLGVTPEAALESLERGFAAATAAGGTEADRFLQAAEATIRQAESKAQTEGRAL